MLVAHDTKWVSELAEVLDCKPGRWGGWVFRRGFVEYFHLPANTIVVRGAALAEFTPIRELFLNPVELRDVVALCRQPWLARVRDLYLLLGSNRLQPAALQALARSPYTSGLKKLVVSLAEEVVEDAALMAEFEGRFRGIWTG